MIAPDDPTALSERERDQLRFLRASNGSHPGIGKELIERAIAGDMLAPSLTSKIRAVLIAG
jgi:hypothetical protein